MNSIIQTVQPQSALANSSPRARAGADDYARVRDAIEYLSRHWKKQPEIEEIAAHIGLSGSHFSQLFRRWAGLTPKQFLQALTIDHARVLLRNSVPVLDTSLEVGLSGPGRLHDLFVTHEAMSPGEYGSGGEGLTLAYGFHASPFGEALAVITPRGLAALGWVDEKDAPGKASGSGKSAGGREGALADMQRRWPRAEFVQDENATEIYARRAFDQHSWISGQPLRVVLIGTDFQIRVWESLLKIPIGSATTYSSIAKQIGKPKASRAVGAAVGRNPISFVVPCHRVLGSGGALTGYHWGLTRKPAIIGGEAGLSVKS